MEHTLYCQSCGMPLDSEEVMGTEAGGARTREYCTYCYKDGAYTQDVTMEEMIEISLKRMKELFKEDPAFDEAQALAQMRSFFPGLKRWKA
ncbi:zinc ribbon domain-containing protein [Christensenellaceae bacterium OttesenSCG-928-K19]|nr:zinc ribbon domain-containing protein [Christensenellaceae bacterium OttesenSCG-928-K19]